MKLVHRIQNIYLEFPRRFWVVVVVSFIDHVGGTMLFPFFSLYITQKFQVGMTQAGLVLGLFSIFGLFGNIVGGALTDRFGRRYIIIAGLVFSAGSTLAFGLVNEFNILIPLAAFIGFLSDIAGPAHQAMIADILPKNQRQEGFGILRVVANMSWIIGPTIAGVVANRSFFALFVMDAIISSVVAVLFFLFIPETKPQKGAEEHGESMLETFKGYKVVARDMAFVAFLAACILMTLVYLQVYNSLSVYLRDVHGIQANGYGFLLTSSAITVILFQFSVTRLVKHRPPFLMMGLGALFYMVGFGMIGFISAYWLMITSAVIITIGEMIIMPTMQALAANFAPEDMRGRYMAAFSLTFMLPAAIGPGLAGVILDNYNPNLLWYIGAVLCLLSSLSFYYLHLRLGKRKRFAPAQVSAVGE
jgi:MFS family permease